MKRNLLSSAIIVAIMALGLTGCDDKKAETETPPPANSQPAAPAPEAPVAKAEAKPETPAQPVVDEQAVFDEKWMSISSAITSYRSCTEQSGALC